MVVVLLVAVLLLSTCQALRNKEAHLKDSALLLVVAAAAAEVVVVVVHLAAVEEMSLMVRVVVKVGCSAVSASRINPA